MSAIDRFTEQGEQRAFTLQSMLKLTTQNINLATDTPLQRSLFSNYQMLSDTYDEYFAHSQNAHVEAAQLVRMLSRIPLDEFNCRQDLANASLKKGGITFTVYADNQGVEKIFPFDLIPRVIAAHQWAQLERGLVQRIAALNAFLKDIYHEQRIIKEKIIPQELITSSSGYLPQVCGIAPPGDVYIHIAGIDIVRDQHGQFLVLEDNLRTPSGVSYVMNNRQIMKQVLQPVFGTVKVKSVDYYPMQLRSALFSLLPECTEDPFAVLLTPGSANAAYFEHSYLAQQMGFELVEGQDLFVADKKVFAKTTQGAKRVHVIYRRVDDQFIDPTVFRQDSHLGVAGLLQAYAAGNVILANAIGNGVADDKAIFPYVPAMIRFYLGEEPLLPQVETYRCGDPLMCQYVLQNLEQLVVKVVDGAGGYGMLIGPQSSSQTCAQFAAKIQAHPRNFIAQPMIELSTCPTLVMEAADQLSVEPRRVDLRPFCITGQSTWILPGGLTRVALRAGSYVVNSSQGGGSKDTWVLEDM